MTTVLYSLALCCCASTEIISPFLAALKGRACHADREGREETTEEPMKEQERQKNIWRRQVAGRGLLPAMFPAPPLPHSVSPVKGTGRHARRTNQALAGYCLGTVHTGDDTHQPPTTNKYTSIEIWPRLGPMSWKGRNVVVLKRSGKALWSTASKAVASLTPSPGSGDVPNDKTMPARSSGLISGGIKLALISPWRRACSPESPPRSKSALESNSNETGSFARAFLFGVGVGVCVEVGVGVGQVMAGTNLLSWRAKAIPGTSDLETYQFPPCLVT